MKILFLSAASSIHTVKWVNALAERGHDVYLAYNRGHEPKGNQINENVRLCPLKYSSGIAYYLNAEELKRLEKQIQPDVINVHYASGYGTLARVSRIGPYLLSVWGSDVYEFPYKSKLNRYILKKNVNSAKMLASTSECMAQQLRNVMKNPHLQIVITPFGVNLERFIPDENKEKRKNEIFIGNVKALEAVYRIDDLIKAIAILKKRRLNVNLKVFIYGEGKQRSELEELIQQLQLEEEVFLKGKIPNSDVPNALRGLDIFCATSEKESFGVAVIEAMAMRKPVVASDAEGFQEVMEHNKTGFIVEKRNVKAIADKLEQLVLDKNLRQSFGQAGRRRVEILYDWEKNVDVMEDLYKQLRGRENE